LGSFRAITSEADSRPVLGLHGYTLLVEALKTNTPIIGFGGITTADVTALLETGIYEIVISEEINRSFDTIKIFHQLLNASSTSEQRTFE
jgi:thiamine-phosphate pyrophosphorylase